MKIGYRTQKEAEEILNQGGIILDTVDCKDCGATFVPHLVTDDGPPYGLCELHFAWRMRGIPFAMPKPEDQT